MRKLTSFALALTLGSSALTGVPASALDPVKLGDFMHDGYVDANDASAILAYYAAVSTGDNENADVSAGDLKTADMDGDGAVNAADASYVLEYYSNTATGGELTSEEFMDVKKLASKGFYVYPNMQAKIGNDQLVVTLTDLTGEEYYTQQYGEGFTACGYEVSLYKCSGSGETAKEELVCSEYVSDFSKGERTISYYSGDVTEKCDIVKTAIPEALDLSSNVSYMVKAVPHYKIKGVDAAANPLSAALDKLPLIINSAKLTPHNEYPLYNIKGATPTFTRNYKVSDADKKILDDFAKEHFTDDMTNYDKLEYTWRWLNKNVTYASGDLYKEIISDSWVSACFVKKKGQCLQYNGAIAEMLAYMGYDVYMLEMWLGANNTNQHFRTEVNIDGQAYSIEVGNDGAYSGWMWFFEPIESSIKGAK